MGETNVNVYKIRVSKLCLTRFFLLCQFRPKNLLVVDHRSQLQLVKFRIEVTTVPEFIKPIAFVGILAAISILGIGVYTQISKPCGLREKKEFGVFCVPDSIISSGGKAFPFANKLNNTYRDQGVEAFKQGKYQQASDLFKKSLGEYPNDPEVLIYKNNAQARLQPYPFKIAVVVPITPDSSSRAEEILRGVAQSQEKFAQNRGLTAIFM